MSDPRPLHVTVETRRVYRSARGYKMTRHAAYVAAAKQLIAERCARWDEERYSLWQREPAYARTVLAPDGCAKDSRYQCRFHKFTPPEEVEDGEPCGMLYYRRVKARLVRFLKFVDRRRAKP